MTLTIDPAIVERLRRYYEVNDKYSKAFNRVVYPMTFNSECHAIYGRSRHWHERLQADLEAAARAVVAASEGTAK